MDHECSKCTFVASMEDIYVSPQVLREPPRKPVYLGAFTMPKFFGHANFYVLECKECYSVVVDQPHDYLRDGSLFFVHYDCPEAEETSRGRCTIMPIKDKEVYRREKKLCPGKRSRIKIDGFTTVASGDGYTVFVKNNSPLAVKHRKTSLQNFLLGAFIVAIIGLIYFYYTRP